MYLGHSRCAIVCSVGETSQIPRDWGAWLLGDDGGPLGTGAPAHGHPGAQTPWAAWGTSELAWEWDSSVACLFEDRGCCLCPDRLGLQGWPVTPRPGAGQQGGLALNPAAHSADPVLSVHGMGATGEGFLFY